MHLLQKSPLGKLGIPQAAPPPQSSATNGKGKDQDAQIYSLPPANLKSSPERAPVLTALPTFLSGEAQNRSSSAPKVSTSAVGAVASLSTSLQLKAGTYLWIRLNRALPEDGIFTFQGSLMPPVERSGTVPLRPGTGIKGSGTVRDGDIANILVTELVIQGVHYKLQGVAGGTSKDAAGSGWAVPFYQGHELEMQLTTASVYRETLWRARINP